MQDSASSGLVLISLEHDRGSVSLLSTLILYSEKPALPPELAKEAGYNWGQGLVSFSSQCFLLASLGRPAMHYRAHIAIHATSQACVSWFKRDLMSRT